MINAAARQFAFAQKIQRVLTELFVRDLVWRLLAVPQKAAQHAEIILLRVLAQATQLEFVNESQSAAR